MPLPLPQRQVEPLRRSRNLSLLFDRGFDGYDQNWHYVKANAERRIEDGKTKFLTSFVRQTQDAAEYERFLERRDAVFSLRAAVVAEATSSSPMVVGLGRWNPTELGFNLDRFAGCPFIPGSSIKGMLREAARLLGEGGIESDPPISPAVCDHWKTHLDLIFGRDTATSSLKTENEEAGVICFHDAYPLRWKPLEVDVMTPHARDYYAGETDYAADWEDPVPVHFLRIPAGTAFRFWFERRRDHPEADLARVTALLPIALDWLGIGAKKSSGYGWFAGDLSDDHPKEEQRSAPPAAPERAEWHGVVLHYERNNGSLHSRNGHEEAFATAAEVTAMATGELVTRLKDKNRKRAIIANITVEPFGNRWRIVAIANWRES